MRYGEKFYQEVKPAHLVRSLIALLNYKHNHTHTHHTITKPLGSNAGPKILPLKWLLLHFPLLCRPYTTSVTPQAPGRQWVSK